MSVVLDGVLLALVVVFAALGVGRGIQREAVTLIGILLGAVLAEMWSPVWAITNAARFNQDVAGTQALIALALVLGCAIFIGYGGALLLPSRRQLAQGRARVFGGIAGAINGLLLLGFVLRYATPKIEPAPVPLFATTRIGSLLIQRLPTLLLFGALAGVAIVLVRLIQRLLVKIHGKAAQTATKPAAKPAAKPVTAAAKPAAAAPPTPKPEPPKPPAPDSTTNPVLRDLLLQEHKKPKQ